MALNVTPLAQLPSSVPHHHHRRARGADINDRISGDIVYDTIRYVTIRYDTLRYDTIRYDTLRYVTLDQPPQHHDNAFHDPTLGTTPT